MLNNFALSSRIETILLQLLDSYTITAPMVHRKPYCLLNFWANVWASDLFHNSIWWNELSTVYLFIDCPSGFSQSCRCSWSLCSNVPHKKWLYAVNSGNKGQSDWSYSPELMIAVDVRGAMQVLLFYISILSIQKYHLLVEGRLDNFTPIISVSMSY